MHITSVGVEIASRFFLSNDVNRLLCLFLRLPQKINFLLLYYNNVTSITENRAFVWWYSCYTSNHSVTGRILQMCLFEKFHVFYTCLL